MTMTPETELELVWRARQGNTQAFTALVEEHQTFVYNLALRTLSNPDEAQDVVQEAFLRAWQALPHFREQARFRTWLYRIVVNLCYNHLPRIRRDLASLPVDEDYPIESPPITHIEKEELSLELQHQISRLPRIYQVLLELRYRQELSYNEIAEVVAMPLGTVKTGLHRAHQQLYRSMNAREEALS